jgi:8-oxo-dGTP pyrophosphatase MutT (NUDIX family)
MAQMYKVFIKHQPVQFINPEQAQLTGSSDIIVHEPTKEKVRFYVEKIEENKIIGDIYFISNQPEKVFFDFCSLYTSIDAAGGIIKNTKGEILFIFRLGTWDLPKGKANQGEDARETALREVEEETGVKNAEITGELTPTYHTYTIDDKRILKKTRWFEMKCPDGQNLVPQFEEDITELKWVSIDQIQSILNNTYPSLIELLRSVI